MQIMQSKITKKCSSCHQTKTDDQFYKSKKKSMGLDCYCKLCRKKKNSRWTRANKQHKHRYAQQYYDDNKDIVLAKNRKWYYDHQEAISNKRKKAYQERKKHDKTTI